MSQSYLNEMTAIWKTVRASFHSYLSSETVELWFGELTVTAFENNIVTLSTSSEFKLNVIKRLHLENVKKGFCDLLGFDVDVEVVLGDGQTSPREVISTVEKENEAAVKKPRDVVPSIPNHASPQNFNFEYTFDNFIIGSSNKFAHAACVAVADNPATNYNPLFIYGQSGLGKTHLMYAIINQLKHDNPNINIIYVKGDDFTNQLVESIKSSAPHQFREKYRKCDVLLIDDIQFIAGKESTQEEFFHTFNSLFEEHKQIILTSDRPPRDIKTLEDRLRTRFEWGLIADIQPPDLELRIAIIKKKAEQVNITLPDDVLMFLAENLRSNIRQIEGAIKKLGALTFLSGKELNMELAKSCISDLLGGAEPVSITVDKIFASIFKKYGVKKEDIIGSRRTKDVAWARHVSIYLIRAITDMSFPNIGKILGRDHSTIMSSIDAVERKIQADNMFSLELEEMKKEITGQ